MKILLDSEASAPGPLWSGYDMAALLAPFYWGTIISVVLFGVTVIQAYNYFPSKDRVGVQVIAASMIIMDFASTVLCAEGMYIYMVPQFGSLLPFNTLTVSLSIECYLAGLITYISQLYFAWQIWTVLNNRAMLKYTLAGLVAAFGAVGFVGGFTCATVMIIDSDNVLSHRSTRFAISVGIAKGAAALSDIVATISLCYCLGSERTEFRYTNSLIKRLMGYIVKRGILVTLIQSLCVILFYTTTSRLYWLAMHVNVTRLYANTFFAMLNGREHLRDGLHATNPTAGFSARIHTDDTAAATELEFSHSFSSSQDKYLRGKLPAVDGTGSVRIDTVVYQTTM